MRSYMVVAIAPCPHHRPGMAEGREQHLVQAPVAEATIKAFDVAVLPRIGWRDGVLLDPSVWRPSQAHQAGRVCAVVAHDQQRLASNGDDRIEFARDTLDSDVARGSGVQSSGHLKDADTPAAHQRVACEVQAPASARSRGAWRVRACYMAPEDARYRHIEVQ